MSSESPVWIGFDLGGTKMLSVAYDEHWKELGRRRRKTRGREGSDSGVQRIVSTIEKLLDENELDRKTIAGIGIGCPGPIDMAAGRILSTPNLGWGQIDIGQPIAAAPTILGGRMLIPGREGVVYSVAVP